ncbi:MAG: hypothetical protein GTN78_20765 [Gemmatimonadales bacterium]|nr:hypothetical protein [Gemmatimonadales bacterium]NIN10115.1 hypothetical protein [Gemmatimonadales bacterium]NIR02599.1 hypothetical protein [Gemmatimonadales bacterium]NIS66293.1 hypothetical protein [Gemmatimonadales bacterium]
MSFTRRIAAPLGFLVAACLACAGDNTGPDDGSGNGTPTLGNDVQPIFTNNCAFSGCHGSTNTQPPGKAMNLSAGQAFANIVDVSAIQVPSRMRVLPGQPDESYLVNKIEGTQASVGGTGGQMPLGRSPLSQAQINTIRAWIAAGAQNN